MSATETLTAWATRSVPVEREFELRVLLALTYFEQDGVAEVSQVKIASVALGVDPSKVTSTQTTKVGMALLWLERQGLISIVRMSHARMRPTAYYLLAGGAR